MELFSQRWKDGDVFEWLFFLSSVTLAGTHFYVALADPLATVGYTRSFVLLGLAILVGPLLYFTTFWNPVFYLLGALLTCSLGVVWVLDGLNRLLIGLITGIPAIGVIILGSYLFLRNETVSLDDSAH
jgi:tetrahydromethanopterin S-methyltransferase subunit C